jgi:hypothetical protein
MWGRNESFTIMVITHRARNLNVSVSTGTAGDAGADTGVDANASVGSRVVCGAGRLPA